MDKNGKSGRRYSPEEKAATLLAFTGFPRGHWRQIWSTNPLERLNREIKRRTDVEGVFPNPEALLRLTTAVLIEQHDEWAASNRRYLSEGSLKTLTNPDPLEAGGGPATRHRLKYQHRPTHSDGNYTTTRDVIARMAHGQ